MPQHKEMTSSHVERLTQQALKDLDVALSRPHASDVDIVVDGSHQPIRIPRSVASALREVLANSVEGRPVEVVAVRKELTTQQAADLLHVSRPHVVKLIDTGVLAGHKVGAHRRLYADDVFTFKRERDAAQRTTTDE